MQSYNILTWYYLECVQDILHYTLILSKNEEKL